MTASPDRSPRDADARLAPLDTLRGAAILAVMASHFLPGRFHADSANDLLVGLGRGGVTLFFILSGYLMFRNVQRQPLAIFVSRRLFKILPAYWFNIGFLLAADLALAGMPHHSAKSYLASFFAVSDLLHTEAVSGVYWTLLIEIKFYVFLALQWAVFGPRRIDLIFFALVGLEAVGFFVQGHGSLTLTYFPVFYAGIALYRAEQAGWRGSSLVSLGVVVLTLTVSIALFTDAYNYWSAGYLLADVALFIIAMRARLASKIMNFFGRTSYSNYLYHSLVGAAVLGAFSEATATSAVAAVILFAVMAATAAAVVGYHVVEVPMVRIGRRLEGRLGWRNAERAAPTDKGDARHCSGAAPSIDSAS
jgi:peptidoglycan/LPS O-acetylase OafA/YrhL